MKISMLFVDGAKQVMLTPESDHEKKCLRMIQPNDTLKAVSKWGDFDSEPSHMKVQVAECQGGYYRPFPEGESLMFVIRNNDKDS